MDSGMKLIPKDTYSWYCLKLPEDKAECSINGTDITPDGAIIVGDRDNKKLKVFHSVKKYHCSPKFEYEPADAAVMDRSEVIVTLMDGLRFTDRLYVVDIKTPDKPTLKGIQSWCCVSSRGQNYCQLLRRSSVWKNG